MRYFRGSSQHERVATDSGYENTLADESYRTSTLLDVRSGLSEAQRLRNMAVGVIHEPERDENPAA